MEILILVKDCKLEELLKDVLGGSLEFLMSPLIFIVQASSTEIMYLQVQRFLEEQTYRKQN